MQYTYWVLEFKHIDVSQYTYAHTLILRHLHKHTNTELLYKRMHINVLSCVCLYNTIITLINVNKYTNSYVSITYIILIFDCCQNDVVCEYCYNLYINNKCSSVI